MTKKKAKADALQVGDRVWAAGKPGTITGFSKDGQNVPWIVCDDGENWDARDLGSVYRIPTLKAAAEKVVAYLDKPGANYRSVEWECVIGWLQRAVAEANRMEEPKAPKGCCHRPRCRSGTAGAMAKHHPKDELPQEVYEHGRKALKAAASIRRGLR